MMLQSTVAWVCTGHLACDRVAPLLHSAWILWHNLSHRLHHHHRRRHQWRLCSLSALWHHHLLHPYQHLYRPYCPLQLLSTCAQMTRGLAAAASRHWARVYRSGRWLNQARMRQEAMEVAVVMEGMGTDIIRERVAGTVPPLTTITTSLVEILQTATTTAITTTTLAVHPARASRQRPVQVGMEMGRLVFSSRLPPRSPHHRRCCRHALHCRR